MLGRKNKRHLVPTRWSISATDDIISSYLVKKIYFYQSIDKFEVIRYNHFSNYYSIIFIPSDVWSFEMVEAWYDQNNVNKFFLESDYETPTGLDHYPRIAGAYFAAKLGILEYLTTGKKRKCSVLVFREIRPEYLVPLGVWQIREGIRDALRIKQTPTTTTTTTTSNSFSDFRKALLYASKGMTVPLLDWLRHSEIYKNYGKKTLISDFFENKE
jgi:DNA repair protein NreA